MAALENAYTMDLTLVQSQVPGDLRDPGTVPGGLAGLQYER